MTQDHYIAGLPLPLAGESIDITMIKIFLPTLKEISDLNGARLIATSAIKFNV